MFATYRIFKEGRPAGNKWYSTYEAARQAVRKLMRKKLAARHKGQPRAPMSCLGYAIKRV